jgi:hypothetical protein
MLDLGFKGLAADRGSDNTADRVVDELELKPALVV